MLTKKTCGQTAHKEIDHIFKDLLPANGMAERPEQIALAHRMLDTMLGCGIALCDAGTGIGKTYAYLVAGTVYHRYRAACGFPPRPILISTSSIALQTAARDDYLPFLSDLLMADGMAGQPIQAVIRKGKAHYVCDRRLRRRLRQVNLTRKNPAQAAALFSLQEHLDADEAAHLSDYDRERVCVPKVCDCNEESCRYRTFLDTCGSTQYPFQICNHNLLLADAIHRERGLRPILPYSCAIIMDEAHKLPETARQMFGDTLEAEDFRSLIETLKDEQFTLAAQSLEDAAAPLLREMEKDFDGEADLAEYTRLLVLPARCLSVMWKQIGVWLLPPARRQLESLISAVSEFSRRSRNKVYYLEADDQGGTKLCATIPVLEKSLRSTFWSLPQPILLTSGTLAVGSNFHRFKEETGLLTDGRVTESVSPSPFDYKNNCLLHLPCNPPHLQSETYYDELAEQIGALLRASHGHALVLFTSYIAMSAIRERLSKQNLPWHLFTMGRNAVHTMEQFKKAPGSVLLATGAAWEGFDFPGDSVSMLIIPRLPFSHPDAVKEREREAYPDLRSFIRAVVTPEMQIKLRQGFGRAIRTETDTCVVSILDERASRSGRYFRAMRDALPDMRITSSLRTVEKFFHSVKSNRYFTEAMDSGK